MEIKITSREADQSVTALTRDLILDELFSSLQTDTLTIFARFLLI
jgi:hypothetical protein